jgi:hypothetical protein
VLKLLEVVPRVEKLTIVNEGRDSAIETLDRLVQVNNNFAPFPAGKESVASDVGFARFIDDGRLLSFLAT